jgi:biopolymer transport protein ExbD
MAMGVTAGKSSSGRRRGIAEINVTPLVDVMLVLLVIFMITAPTLKEGFSVDIPQAEATQSVPITDAFMVTVTPAGYVLKPSAHTEEERYQKLTDLVTDLEKYKADMAAQQKPPVVVVVGDKDAHYDRIIQVWDAVRTAGIAQISFQVEPGNASPAAPAAAK